MRLQSTATASFSARAECRCSSPDSRVWVFSGSGRARRGGIRHLLGMAGKSAPPRVQSAPDPKVLIEIARMKMPFGRYSGRCLIDLPEPYLVWFSRQGFPKGRLGMLLATLFEIKANGLEPLLAPFREKTDPRYQDQDPRQYREGDRSLDTGFRKPGH